MSETFERIHLRITGRVQGVWYRASACEQAKSLGLRGWVRNRPDGRVELVAEGPRAGLESLLEWCRTGPPLARVDDVETEWRPAAGGFSSFEVK